MLLPILVLLIGGSASTGAFVAERGAVRHTDQTLLRQYAIQGSLILSPLVGQTPPDVTQLSRSLTSDYQTGPGWPTTAAAIATKDQYGSLAVLKAVSNRLLPVSQFGILHSRFGTSADAQVIAAASRSSAPYAVMVTEGTGRWLTQLFRTDTAGLFVYTESPISNTLVDLASLPGHPFAGIDGAVYVGREAPQNLVLATTKHLPLSGERAVAIISSSTLESATAPQLTTRVGSVSQPGGYLLVIHPIATLSGSPSAELPWILLILGVLSTIAVASLLGISEGRRARLASTVDSLEASNTELDRAVSRQKTEAARFSAMVRSSSDLTTVIDEDGRISYQSPSSSTLLGRSPESLSGALIQDLIHPDDLALWRGAFRHADVFREVEVTQGLRLRAADGSYLSVETRLTNLVGNPAVGGVVLNSRDVTEQQRLENELRHQAFHDSLTGLANRALFEDRLENALNRHSRTGGSVGVLFLDLDDFKAVNDGRGHDAGDELLQVVGDRLMAAIRSGDTLARIGGDEFAVLVEGADESGAGETAERIRDSLQRPLATSGGQTAVHASIGVATTSRGADTAQELLRNADVAMYAAKNAGKDRVVIFHTGLHDEVIRRLELELDLSRALENEELSVLYQPLVDLESTEIVGVEALMRWEHPERGTVMPGEFIPAAESTGLIICMGKWMLQRACQDVRKLQQTSGRPELHLSVNLSVKQLDHPDIVEHVQSALDESGLAARLLTLEITESVFMASQTRSVMALRQLKALGVRLSIDDFGTGFSSLGYLHRLPVDELKIDRSFVAATDSPNGDSHALVRTIIGLAQDFGLETVAEGIETQKQLEAVRQAGCHFAQGYLFARPVPLPGLLSYLAGSATGFAKPGLRGAEGTDPSTGTGSLFGEQTDRHAEGTVGRVPGAVV